MNTKKQVGIWIRVSTDMQVKDESPEHHEQRARYYAQAKGWEVVVVYRLDAVSGKTVWEQSETKRMLADVKSGTITGLIFSKLARLARNTKELLEFAEIFRSLEADLISLSENIDTSSPAGRLFYTMIAAMAEWERAEISQRVADSVPVRARMGKSTGGAAPFGYKWVNNQLEIDEEEAPIRKLLYELYKQFRRKKAVATELNKRGYRTRGDSKFSDTTVERLLRDSSAKGERRANYTRSLGQGKQWVTKPQEEWVIVSCPAIISAELWDECNAIFNEQHKKRTGPRVQHLLAGFVHCHCGKKMYIYHGGGNYACKACKNKVAAADLDEIYHLQLKSFLLADSELSEYMDASSKKLSEKETLLTAVEKDATALRKEMQKLVDMRIGEELTKEAFQSYYKPLEERMAQMEQNLPELQATVDFLRIQYLSSDTVLHEAKDLYDRWSLLPFEEKRGIVELITENIVIGKTDISLNFNYEPVIGAPSSEKDGNKQHTHVCVASLIIPSASAAARPVPFRST